MHLPFPTLSSPFPTHSCPWPLSTLLPSDFRWPPCQTHLARVPADNRSRSLLSFSSEGPWLFMVKEGTTSVGGLTGEQGLELEGLCSLDWSHGQCHVPTHHQPRSHRALQFPGLRSIHRPTAPPPKRTHKPTPSQGHKDSDPRTGKSKDRVPCPWGAIPPLPQPCCSPALPIPQLSSSRHCPLDCALSCRLSSSLEWELVGGRGPRLTLEVTLRPR